MYRALIYLFLIPLTECILSTNDCETISKVPELRKATRLDWSNIEGEKESHYQIDLCHNRALGGDCNSTAICQTFANGSKINLGMFKTSPLSPTVDTLDVDYHDDGSTLYELSFFGGHCEAGQSYGSVVQIVCDEGEEGVPELLNDFGCLVYFVWHTNLVCKNKEPVPFMPHTAFHSSNTCSFKNMEQFKDISRLRKATGDNWEIYDSRGDFFINVCGPLSQEDRDTESCDKGAAVCRVGYNGTAISFGQAATAQLSVVEGGHLRLSYTDGTPCSGSKRYSSSIFFMCQTSRLASTELILLGQPAHCEAEFLWETPYACTGKDRFEKPAPDKANHGHIGKVDVCAITDADTGYEYNFHPFPIFKIKTNQDKRYKAFYMSMCGTLNSTVSTWFDSSEDPLVAVSGLTKADPPTLVNLGFKTDKEIEFTRNGDITFTFHSKVLEHGPKTKVELALFCTREGSLGHPVFLHSFTAADSVETFVFSMATPIVCPPNPVECSVMNQNGELYDLTPLAKDANGNWEARHDNERYYLNVCRSLNVGNRSPMFATTCEVDNVGACSMTGSSQKKTALNIGYVLMKPHLTEAGDVVLRYMGGEACDKHSPHASSTTILFECSDTPMAPVFVKKTAECEFIFNWKHPAACPLKVLITMGQDCTVTDPRFFFNYDLSRLKSKDFALESDYGAIKFSICSPLRDGCLGNRNSAFCVRLNNGTLLDHGDYTDKMEYSEGSLFLFYERPHLPTAVSSMAPTMIHFECDYSATAEGDGSYSLLPMMSDESAPIIIFKTNLACPPYKQIDCSAYSEDGRHYDLSKLTMLHDNYEVTYRNAHGRRVRVYLNICHSVIHKAGVACRFDAAVCEVDSANPNGNSRYANFGEVVNGPFWRGGLLSLTYENGEMCTAAMDLTHKRTNIGFRCGTELESEPFLESSNECELNFVWSTVYACPVDKQPLIGNHCMVKNPQTGYTFDIRSLKHPSSSYKVEDKSDPGPHRTHYWLNVCGEPVADAPCPDKSEICLETPDKQWKSLGSIDTSVIYRADGVVMLKYTSHTTRCPGKKSSEFLSTEISLVCGKEGSGYGQPTFIASADDCIYFFSWHTTVACEKQVNCAIERPESLGGGLIDLDQLMNTAGHFFALATESSDKAIYMINVCRPLNPYPGFQCPAASAACLVDLGKKQYKSLGLVDKSLQLDSDGRAFIEYEGGDQCRQNSQLKASTKIIFVCVQKQFEAMPVMVEMTSSCTYIIEWRTVHACAVSPTDLSASSRDNCTFVDYQSGLTFDLNRLKPEVPYQSYLVKFADGFFSLSPCPAFRSPFDKCSDAAVCQYPSSDIRLGEGGAKRHVSWGVFTNVDVSYEDQWLRMEYTGGDTCSEHGVVNMKRSAEIRFKCDRSAGKGSPKFAFSFACRSSFIWMTDVICDTEPEDCVFIDTTDGRRVDLRMLSSVSHAWEYNDSNDNRYWVNICRGVQTTLAVETREACPPDTAVCMEEAHTGRIVSLGSVLSKSVSYGVNQLTVKYTAMSRACNPHREQTTISEVHFTCGHNLGRPEFIGKRQGRDECAFQFDWVTRLVCMDSAAKPIALTPNGILFDDELGLFFNFRPLLNSTFIDNQTRSDDVRYTYEINMSAGTMCGNDSAICQIKHQLKSDQFISLGQGVNKQFYFKGSDLMMVLSSNGHCDNNSAKNITTHVIFECQQSAGIGHPKFIYQSADCDFLFNWPTAVICMTSDVIGHQESYRQLALQSMPELLSDLKKGATISLTVMIAFGAGLSVLICLTIAMIRQKREVGQFVMRVFSRSDTNYDYTMLHNTDSEETALLCTTSAPQNSSGLEEVRGTSVRDGLSSHSLFKADDCATFDIGRLQPFPPQRTDIESETDDDIICP